MGRSVAVGISLAAMLLTGCPESSTDPPDPRGDGGDPLGDAGPYVDTDGDGLCDLTERTRRTDPLEPDTDGDGFTDYYEVVFNYNPTLPASPERANVHVLRESADSAVQVLIEITIRGGGEDFTGAFEGVFARDLEGTTASDFYQSAVAVYANPMDNVAIIEPEAERFRGVVGTTALGFEVRFGFGDNTERRCIRAYPFRYNVKRSDGRIVGLRRDLLLVLPVGETLATGQWCAPMPPCM